MEPTPASPTLQCQKCQTAILPGAAFCNGCGSPVASQALAQVPQTQPQKSSVWVPVRLVAVPLAALLVTFVAERDAPPGEAIGFWFGLQLIPLLVALIVVGFKPLRKTSLFSTIFCCVGLAGLFLCFMGTVQQRLARHQKTEQEIVKEALGIKPVDDTGDPSDRTLARLNHEFMSDILATRKKHDADAAVVQPVLATLYTAGSFQNRQRMEDMIAAVRQIHQIDGVLADSIQRWPEVTRARAEASSLSQQEKQDYMRGFERVYGNSDVLMAWRDVHSIEEQWAAATVDLYTFASQHASGIKAKDKQILIADKSLLSQFNTRFTSSRDLHDKLHAANQRLTAIQSLNMQKLGISNADLGLQK